MERNVKFANIVVDISHEKLDKTFQYIIPDELSNEITIGCQVEIPFGKGNRIITGYVLEITDFASIDETRLKSIIGIKKGSLKVESQLIALAGFIKERYGSTMNKALKTVIPIKQSVKNLEKKYVRLKINKSEALDLYAKYVEMKNTKARAGIIKALTENDILPYNLIKDNLKVSDAIIKNLEKAGIIEIIHNIFYRNPVNDYEKQEYDIKLNSRQQEIADSINADINAGNTNTHLIYGVTGSGKTEVYMNIIENVIQNGKEVIVLIPEIALTYQTIKRFYSKFGNKVSIINSKLSAGEKYDQFERAKNGEVKIMIGPRSALFTPFRNLGLIVIDEEHEGAYKSDQVPKYHARDVAIERGKIACASVVLGSATPAVNTFYKALSGEYILHRLDRRANDKELPAVRIVDLRKELEAGNRDILSIKLKELIKDRLEKKEQVILFINRRGYSSFVSCRACGKSIKCPHCDVTLTLHRKRGGGEWLNCHYCGYSMSMPKQCPICSSKYIGRFGIGTEQVEERINEIFPEAKTLRMDMDTTKGKKDYENILSTFANEEADILVGTQMIVKGHDFKNVSLVGIIAADLSLFSSDYMAAERTFQLLTQAAGRAGRGEKDGEVVIQTYNPDEMCIQTAVTQDYEQFYRNEISYRKLMGYPPVCNMCAILVSDKNEVLAEKVVKDIAHRIEKSNISGLMILGPSKANVSKINDVFRNVVYIKHTDGKVIIKVENAIQKYLESVAEYKDVSVQFDYNPISNY